MIVSWEADIWPRVDARWVADPYTAAVEAPLVVRADAGQVSIVLYVRVSGEFDVSRLRVRVTLDGCVRSFGLTAPYRIAYRNIHLTLETDGAIRTRPLKAELLLDGVPENVQSWNILLTLAPPVTPWVPAGHLRRPWMRALELAVAWCSGLRTGDEVLARLQHLVWSGIPGNPHPIKVFEAGTKDGTTGTWNLLHFVEMVDSSRGDLGWGCHDATAFSVFFASILGVQCESIALRAAGSPSKAFKTTPVRTVGGNGVESLNLRYHELVLADGRIWDNYYRISGTAVQSVPYDVYIAQFVAGTTPMEWGAPTSRSWEFSECVPLPQDASTPPPAPNVVAWAAALGVLPANLYIGYSGDVDGITRSTHIRAYADDDLSLLLIDVYERESAPLVDALADGLRERWLGGVSLTPSLVGAEVEWAISPGPYPSAALLRVGARLVLVRSQGRPLPFGHATQLLALLG